MPMWGPYEAQQGLIISPSGLTHVGPPWQPRTKLAGSQLGSQAGAHMSALMEPIWDPHECAGWVVCGRGTVTVLRLQAGASCPGYQCFTILIVDLPVKIS